MNQIGSFIIYDQDGEIILHIGEMEGAIARKEITNIRFVELDYGYVPTNKQIVAIDTDTNLPILEDIVYPKSKEQLRIEELENELLLTSGIL